MGQSSPNDLIYPPPPPSFPSPMKTSSKSCPNRKKGLKKLGVSENDVKLAEKILDQIPTCPADPNKAERILGYASTRLVRDKALRLLGASEEEVELENAKVLGSLGVAGRRRSFSMVASAAANTSQFDVFLLSRAIRRPSMIAKVTKYNTSNLLRRRRHTFNGPRESELRILRTKARASSMEIDALKARVDELEKKLNQSDSEHATASHSRDT